MRSKIKKIKFIKRLVLSILCMCVLGTAMLAGINEIVKSAAKDNIISIDEAKKIEDIDCILVLGCQVRPDNMPSIMLKDRLMRGVELYYEGVAPKILMSGDHGRIEYNEVETMKKYATDSLIPSEDVFMDHAGFSTYESIYRAREIFEADKIVVVTQEYHMYRALYIAKKLGIDAYGVNAEEVNYAGQNKRDVREAFARCKDFITAMFKVKPRYLGDVIPISGDGNVTND